MLLSEAIEFTFQYRPTWKSSKSEQTNRINTAHGLRVLGDVEVETIKSRHFSTMQDKLLEENKAPATINRICAAVHTVLSELQLNDILQNVPKYRSLTEPDTVRGYFTKEEVNLLIDNASNSLMRNSIRFSIMTGCRLSEMLSLEWGDIDFEEKTITFRNVKTATTTGKQNHVLPLSEALEELLLSIGRSPIDDCIFHWTSKDQVGNTFRKLKETVGLPKDKRTWHTLRHTCGTWMVEAGVPIRSVMSTLNHRNIETTLRYAKGTKQAVREAMDALAV